jgi:hypothetical protein
MQAWGGRRIAGSALPATSGAHPEPATCVPPPRTPPACCTPYPLRVQLFRLPTAGKMLVLVLVALPIVAVGATMLRQVTGLPWHEAAHHTYCVLNSVPGGPGG